MHCIIKLSKLHSVAFVLHALKVYNCSSRFGFEMTFYGEMTDLRVHKLS